MFLKTLQNPSIHIALVLKKSILFSGLDDKIISKLSKIAVTKKIKKDEILFLKDSHAIAIFLLSNGVIDLVLSSNEGKERPIRKIETPGEIFAEAAMFSGDTYPATAVAKTDAEVVVIYKNKFMDFLYQYPEVSIKIIGIMAKLLKHLNMLLEELSFDSVVKRLASYIISISEPKKTLSFQLPIKKRELAYQIGTTPETLSRNLKKMALLGLIEINAKKLKIINLQKLKELIEI